MSLIFLRYIVCGEVSVSQHDMVWLLAARAPVNRAVVSALRCRVFTFQNVSGKLLVEYGMSILLFKKLRVY